MLVYTQELAKHSSGEWGGLAELSTYRGMIVHDKRPSPNIYFRLHKSPSFRERSAHARAESFREIDSGLGLAREPPG